MMNANAICLLGKPPRPSTIFDLIQHQLIENKIAVQVVLPHASGCLETAQWPDGALIIHRGLNGVILDQLAGCETRGWRCCNSPASSIQAQNRHTLMKCLQEAGLPVPIWQQLTDWGDVLRVGSRQSVVVKAADGTVGRGTQVVIAAVGTLPKIAPFCGPYLVEDLVENEGRDRKLYVAGSNCFGLIKPWPRNPDTPSEAFDVPPALKDLALATGAATGLEIFGVDVVLGTDGPVIVDVNVFPSFKGIDEAPAAVIRHLLGRLGA